MLGLGAASAVGAQAAPAQGADANASGKVAEQVMLRLDGDRIYLSEDGKTFQPISLGNTAEADLLRQLLAREGAGNAAIELKPILLAGAGGCGYHWAPADQPADSSHPAASGGGTG